MKNQWEHKGGGGGGRAEICVQPHPTHTPVVVSPERTEGSRDHTPSLADSITEYFNIIQERISSLNGPLEFNVSVCWDSKFWIGPPKWLREPSDTSTSVGESVSLPCATFGYPTPDVTWRKANDSLPDHWTHLVNNRHYRLEGNGSLTILNVQNDDSGYYQCQVSNGIGEGLKKTVSVSIKGKRVAASSLDAESHSTTTKPH
ncbi:down syndrome cell adhesion molecule [Caerostris darwini]|uniref:Down syndrome cell adhesion molecule n=1 Tax=Caerostris darwini TaxID=1538125 RepID=A0AAV4VCF7_9ARAC|nr:down syndrome cell adhesion molecule [Caerostris darwini]